MVDYRALVRGTRRGRLRRPRSAGVTLVETLVVVAIAATLLSIAVPVAQGTDKAGAEARRFLSDAMRVRSAARTRWAPASVRVHKPTRRWRCFMTETDEPILGPGSDSDGWRTLAPGVEFKKITNKDPEFVFLPNGRTFRAAAIIIHTTADQETSWEISAMALSGKLESTPIKN